MNSLPAYQQQTFQPEQLVYAHASLVKRIAHHLKGRLPDTVQVDDLIQAGMIGLLEAARNFDDGQGASFETYAGIRIRGAMLDEVRRHDWAPRSVYRRSREIAEAVRVVENREGRDASDAEIAAQLEIPLEEYHEMLRDASGQRLFSLEQSSEEGDPLVERLPDERGGVFERIQHDDLRNRVAELIANLPERERMVMALYYDEELNLREIGAVIGVTESRICQIHSQALLRLRARIADGLDGGSC